MEVRDLLGMWSNGGKEKEWAALCVLINAAMIVLSRSAVAGTKGHLGMLVVARGWKP